MTREQYLKSRQNNSVTLEDLYEYYKEKAKKPCEFQEFSDKFPIYLSVGGLVDKYWHYYDQKFNVFKLTYLESGLAQFI